MNKVAYNNWTIPWLKYKKCLNIEIEGNWRKLFKERQTFYTGYEQDDAYGNEYNSY